MTVQLKWWIKSKCMVVSMNQASSPHGVDLREEEKKRARVPGSVRSAGIHGQASHGSVMMVIERERFVKFESKWTVLP
jgi:hypothetical protein